MPGTGKACVVVELGPVPEYFVTDVLPVENGGDFVRVTFCASRCLGGPETRETQVVVRLVLTTARYQALVEGHILPDLGLPVLMGAH